MLAKACDEPKVKIGKIDVNNDAATHKKRIKCSTTQSVGNASKPQFVASDTNAKHSSLSEDVIGDAKKQCMRFRLGLKRKLEYDPDSIVNLASPQYDSLKLNMFSPIIERRFPDRQYSSDQRSLDNMHACAAELAA